MGRPRSALLADDDVWATPPEVAVRRVLENHERVLAERAELVAQLRRLTPAWVELRAVLNELKRVLGD